MIKKILCVIIAVLTLMSAVSVGVLSVSAEEVTEVIATNDEATKDEATVDEAELKISDQPKAPESSVDGMVIGYIGDTNTDGKINVKDATAVQKHLAKLINLGERAKLLGDADNNQKLNVRDATTIQKYIAGVEVKSYIWHLMYETGTHKHNYVETVFEVTCEKDGYTGYSCICGDEYKENVVEATGHSYNSKVVYATCVDEGYMLYTCKKCNDSYKKHYEEPTGVHVFENRVCKHCSIEESVYYFNQLKDFVVSNGEYESDINSYYYYLSTGYNTDAAAVIYSKDENAIALTYALYFENSIDVLTLAFTPEDSDFSFYMICQGVFESAGTYNKSRYTMHIKDIENIEYYFYTDKVTKADALAYTLDFIDAALAVYEDNQSELPATIRKLGFTNFVYQ